MNVKTIKTYSANLTLGLNAGYTDRKYSIDEVKAVLLEAQEKTRDEENIMLSAKVNACDVAFLGQDEPSAEIQFIQYPKFPVEEDALKNAIIKLAEYMMDKLGQNRAVIVFTDETVMLEQDEMIDPKIKAVKK